MRKRIGVIGVGTIGAALVKMTVICPGPPADWPPSSSPRQFWVALVVDSGQHPALLKDDVTTPAGVTIDGLMALEEWGLRVALIKAVMAATERSKALSCYTRSPSATRNP